MANTLNLGSGNWGVKDSSLLGYKNRQNGRFIPETFDVARGSAGTRVNQSGLIETPEEILSADLVTNGDFTTDTDWTKGTGWTISGGVASTVGTTKSSIYQDCLVNGTNKVTFTLISGELSIYTTYPTFTNKGSFTVPGTYTVYLESDGVLNRLYFYNKDAGTPLSIDNVSAVEVNRDNLARIDYLDDSAGVLLTEPQSTNLILNSEPTSNEGPMGGVSYESFDWAIGFSNCAKIPSSNTLSFRYGGTTLASTEYTISAFVIMDDLSEPTVGATTTSKDFDFSIGGVNSLLTYNSNKYMGNNIWRTSATYTNTATPNGTNNGIIRNVGHSAKGFRVVGWQLEQLSYATSYIPTEDAVATRLADVVNNAGDVNNFNSEEGVLFVETSALVDAAPNRRISINSGDYINSILINLKSTANQIGVIIKVSNSVQIDLTHTVSDVNAANKIALKYKSNDVAMWVNGIEVQSVSLFTAISANTLSKLSFDRGDGNDPFYGKTKNVQVFDTALSDAELITLTTI